MPNTVACMIGLHFFDCDEFLTLPMHDNLHAYLTEPVFERYNAIQVNWMNYSDNDLVYYDNRPVLERFTKPIPFNGCLKYTWPEDFHTKSIVRGGGGKISRGRRRTGQL